MDHISPSQQQRNIVQQCANSTPELKRGGNDSDGHFQLKRVYSEEDALRREVPVVPKVTM